MNSMPEFTAPANYKDPVKIADHIQETKELWRRFIKDKTTIHMHTIFDIETGPLPDKSLEVVMPQFTAPANYKDPVKIADHIQESKELWRRNAALSAMTGRVLAIGLHDGVDATVCGVDDESDLLQWFWDRWTLAQQKNGQHKFVGFCVKAFDIPFLVQRSFVNRVSVPYDLFDGRYLSKDVVDLQERWLCYGRDSKGASLDAVCRACGLGGKNGTGDNFAHLWTTDRDAAIGYLKRDLQLTRDLADLLLR